MYYLLQGNPRPHSQSVMVVGQSSPDACCIVSTSRAMTGLVFHSSATYRHMWLCHGECDWPCYLVSNLFSHPSANQAQPCFQVKGGLAMLRGTSLLYVAPNSAPYGVYSYSHLHAQMSTHTTHKP